MSFKLRSEVIRFMILWTPRSTSCLNFSFLYGTEYNTFALSMTGGHFNRRMIDWRQYKISWLPLWLRWWRIHLQCGRPKVDPWVRKIPWETAWLTTPVFLPGEFHGQRSLAGYSLWDRQEVDTTEQLTHTQDLSVASGKGGGSLVPRTGEMDGMWPQLAPTPHETRTHGWVKCNACCQCVQGSLFTMWVWKGQENICLTDIP